MRDSINNTENNKAAIQSQLKYECEKKALADSIKVAEERKVVQIKLKQEKTLRYALYAGLTSVFVFALIMFQRFKVTNRQKRTIEDQKNLVEQQKKLVDEKQKEILDSIRYAKRIQASILPSDRYINKILQK